MKRGFIITLIILAVILIIAILIAGLQFYFDFSTPAEISDEEVLYTLNDFKEVYNSNFLEEHPYLEELQIVYFYERENVIAKSNKVLDKDSFILLIDNLIENGYVRIGGHSQQMQINSREIFEELDSIRIVDKGINAIFGDVMPVKTYYKDVALEYVFNKTDNNIYFKSSSPYSIPRPLQTQSPGLLFPLLLKLY